MRKPVRLVVAAIALVFVCLAQNAGKMASFDEFIQQVKRADPKDFLNKPGVAVKDAAVFNQMRDYILKLYNGVHVQHSYRAAEQAVDCVPVNEQPSLRAQGGNKAAPPPSDEKLPSQACSEGTIPMRRITLEEVTRFRTLDDYLHKAPHGHAPIPPLHPMP
jgi:hypothetical protein